MAPTKQIGLRLPLDVADWLQEKAQADDRSLAYIAAKVIRAEMAREAEESAREAKPKPARKPRP